MSTTQQSGVNKTLLATLIIGMALIVLFAVVITFSFIGAANSGNRFENRIKAVYSNNENILSNYTQKVQEAAQVTDMQKNDIKDVIQSALKARYGDGGAKAVFQAIHEQNPTIDSTVYRKLQEIIQVGRDEFQNNQTTLIDVKRSYSTALGEVPLGFFMRMAGYPKINLDEYKVLVDTGVADQFKSGTSHAVQLRPASQLRTSNPKIRITAPSSDLSTRCWVSLSSSAAGSFTQSTGSCINLEQE